MLKRIRGLFQRRDKAQQVDTATSSHVDPAPEATAAMIRRALEPPHVVHRGPTIAHMPIPESELDPDAVRIIRRLTRFRHTAYLVGGCVRDLLLDRKPKDFDIATSATPRQVRRVFSNCRIIGRRFRLAHVYFQSGKIIEVATFRAKGTEDDAGETAPEQDDLLIRDDNVFGTPEEDALRRDFTINALFYDVNEGNVIDHAGGLLDLRRRLVRTIGDPDVRFREDPIRVLRAIKFAARLGFELEEGTREALLRTRGEIPRSAPPRILEEINRFCRGGAGRRSFELLAETGVFPVILPELARAYERPGSWETALALLAALDQFVLAGREPETGEILACILLPALEPEMGWTVEGKATHRRGLQVRDLIDETLRPIALRLRVPRRDQERARQIAATLHRLVPAGPMRKGLLHAILRRPAFADALWILRALAEQRDGDFARAHAFWQSIAERHGAVQDEVSVGSEEPDAEQAAAEQPETVPSADGSTRTGRRRRRSRRRKPAQGGAPASRPAAQARPPARQPGLPPPWDDDYFFAALPTVPPLESDPADTDRYGAGAVLSPPHARPRSRSTDEASPDAAEPAGNEAAAPSRRRRRPRRRRRGGGGAAAAS